MTIKATKQIVVIGMAALILIAAILFVLLPESEPAKQTDDMVDYWSQFYSRPRQDRIKLSALRAALSHTKANLKFYLGWWGFPDAEAISPLVWVNRGFTGLDITFDPAAGINRPLAARVTVSPDWGEPPTYVSKWQAFKIQAPAARESILKSNNPEYTARFTEVSCQRCVRIEITFETGQARTNQSSYSYSYRITPLDNRVKPFRTYSYFFLD